jgi:hypothetical protein
VRLVGTFQSEKGSFAFFDGSRSEYKTVQPVGGAIVGYKIASISNDGIKLATDAKNVELLVGMQMRRDEGEWEVVGNGRVEPSTSRTPNDSASGISSAEESDVVKRLMEKRERDLK